MSRLLKTLNKWPKIDRTKWAAASHVTSSYDVGIYYAVLDISYLSYLVAGTVDAVLDVQLSSDSDTFNTFNGIYAMILFGIDADAF